jgi:hypothetical protein
VECCYVAATCLIRPGEDGIPEKMLTLPAWNAKSNALLNIPHELVVVNKTLYM